MIILTGNSLGKRQQELNAKVNEAKRNNINFDEIKLKEEKTDIDRLFKIDLASKYKNIHYIIEVLKSGDSLYVSRALNCSWIYDDEHSPFINSDYLHHSVFPFMSLKMKKKTLTAISINVLNNARASNFFEYCVNTKMHKIALKFLVSTSDAFKVDFISSKQDNYGISIAKDDNYLVFLIGNSFDVADAYLQKVSKYEINSMLHKIRHLYSVKGEKFLDLLEKYYNIEKTYNRTSRFGKRISKDIIKNHKSRILRNPHLYVDILSTKALFRNIKVDDAKTLTTTLLPQDGKKFWRNDFCQSYKFIIEIIPLTERYQFVKQAFNSQYPNEGFEMLKSFYDLNYYTLLMTRQEKETWALRHIASGEEILGSGNDYIWYKFVCFQTAFKEIKNLIRITQDLTERCSMIKILVEAAKDQKDLTKLLEYYYERHINEAMNQKVQFLESVFDIHNVFDFEDQCWTALSKILHSMGVYDSLTSNNSEMQEYKLVALIYHITHDQQIPDGLLQYLDSDIMVYHYKSQIKKLNKERTEIVYKFLLQFYVVKVKSYENETYDDKLQEKLRTYLNNSCKLWHIFNKTETDIPDILMKFIKLDWDRLKYNSIFDDMRSSKQITQEELIRLLKKDSKLVVNSLAVIKETLDKSYRFQFNQLLKKLRIYFYQDVAKEYLSFFLTSIMGPNMTYPAYDALANVIFQVADAEYKVEYMLKYVPENPKIDHYHIDRHLLHIQESICRYAYMSRPLVPLDNIFMYLKGDYVHYCLPMFNYILSNAPTNLCIKFVEMVLDSPLSLQKHGLRMAFKSFTLENLKNLVLNVWKKTKSVSLRNILYKELFNKILSEDENIQIDLSDTLNMFNLNLNENDDKEVFLLLKSDKMPEKVRGPYLESGWQSVSKLPQKIKNWDRQTTLVRCLENNIHLIRQDVIRSIVEKHIELMLIENQIRPYYAKHEIDQLNKAKWDLLARYIVYFDNEEKINSSKELINHVLTKAFEMWNVVHDDIYTLRMFTDTLIYNIDNKSFWKDYKNVNELLTTILNHFYHNFPIEEIYLMVWNLRLKILARTIFYEAKINNQNINRIAHDVAKEFANLMQEYVEKELFYYPLLNNIFGLMKDNMIKFSYDIDDCPENNLCVYVANNLTSIERRETFLLAINIMPIECPDACVDIYKEVIDKIKRFESKEIRCVMHDKFINSEFKKRKYV